MKLRITYRVESYVEGDTIEECRAKFECSDLCSAEFVELISVEDADTFKDVKDKWDSRVYK